MFCHHVGMLPLCRWQFVASNNLPAILVVGIYEYLPCAHVHHRLDGKHHTRHEQHTCATMSVVNDVWLFVEFQSYAMSAEVAHNAIVIFLGMLLDGMADVANKAEWLSRLGTKLHAFLSHTPLLFLLRSGFADDKHT